jgi:AcrR family transcriptional regulator
VARRLAGEVAVWQRERILAAIPPVLVEQGGYGRVAVRHVIERAGVSRRTFYDLFDDWADAFRTAYDEEFERIYEAMIAAAATYQGWPAKVFAALCAALEAAAHDPLAARMVMIEPLCSEPAIASHHQRSLDRFAPLLRSGSKSPRLDLSPRPELEQALIGAVAGIVASRLHRDDFGSLPELAPQLTEFLLIPYLGSTGVRLGEPSSSQASSSPK